MTTQGSTRVQLLLTILLVVLLGGLIGGYIYYGMWQARMNEVPAVVEQPQDSKGLSAEEKQEILDALAKSPTNVIPAEEQERIVKSLAETPSNTLSEAERAKILESLGQN